MKVNEIMTKAVQTISSDASATQAAQKMKNFDIGALPVNEGRQLVGIITDRDIILRVIAENRSPDKTRVCDIMTSKVFSCWQDDSIEEAARIMEDNHVHRLVVLDGNDNPVGILSIGDLAVKCQDEHLTFEVLTKISEYVHQ